MILDTNAVSALSTEDAALIAVLEVSQRHHLPVVVIGEYEFGLTDLRRHKALREWFNLLVAQSAILAVDRETAKHYAAISADLKRVGKPIPSNDLWIAALGVQRGLMIVSRDRHFDLIDGIKRISW